MAWKIRQPITRAEIFHLGDDFESSTIYQEILATTKKDEQYKAQAMAVESLESEDKPNESIRSQEFTVDYLNIHW